MYVKNSGVSVTYFTFWLTCQKPRGQDKMTERNGFPESSRFNGPTDP